MSHRVNERKLYISISVIIAVGLVLLWHHKTQLATVPTARLGGQKQVPRTGPLALIATARPTTLPSMDVDVLASWSLPHLVDKTSSVTPNTADSSSDLHSVHRSPKAIPRIIHQTWAGDKIPKQFVPWVRSWMEQNPTWQYWFWTDSDIHCFMKQHYADYLRLFDSYTYSINRADAMRYFVLHAHGGIYADLDMECMKSLEDIKSKHACFLTEENHAHSYIVHRRSPPANVVNCLMACRPKHPFFGEVIKQLPVQKKQGNDGAVLDQTGPFLLDAVLRRFLNTSSSRLPEDVVTVLPPVYFSATFDPMQLLYLKKTCLKPSNLSANARKVCDRLISNNFVNTLEPGSYADHRWLHTYWDISGFRQKSRFSVSDIAHLVAQRFNASPSSAPPSSNCYTPLLKFGPFQ